MVEVFIVFIKWVMRRWLYWEEGFLMWLMSRSKLFELYVNMFVYVRSVLVCSMANSKAYSLPRSMLGHLG